MKSLWQRLSRIAIFRTLRFRLASTFLLLLSLVTLAVGIAVTQLLSSILETQTEQTLMEELTAFRGYLHFYDSSGEPYWTVDRTDPEEVEEFERLRSTYVVARSDGSMWAGVIDPVFDSMTNPTLIRQEYRQIEATKKPIFKTIQGDEYGPYRVISGMIADTVHRKDYYVAIGRSVADQRQLLRKFRRYYFYIFTPITIFLCILASWFSAGRALAGLQSVEYAARDITGSNLGLQIPARGANDELDRLIGSFNEMSRRLKSSFDQVRQFSTDVSHELRTPLTAIQGQLEVALMTTRDPAQLREAIENALQDVERLSNLVRALLLLSYAETGQLPMIKNMVDLDPMIANLVDQFQIPAEAHEVQLEMQRRQSLPCEVDQTQIERVITNLLSNAIKYTPPGGAVRVWAEPIGSWVRIVVDDTGIGIPEDHLPHIFDRFYRVPDSHPEKGLGLGLSFVASIVKAHGGHISVNSKVGKGSRFVVELPRGAYKTAAPAALPGIPARS